MTSLNLVKAAQHLVQKLQMLLNADTYL